MSVSQSGTCNGLLTALNAGDFALLQPHLKRVELLPREALIGADIPIEQVHFLESGIASIVWDSAGGAVEIGIFGSEGMSGSAVVLGTDRVPHRTFMQVDGCTAVRLAVADLRDACVQSETLRLLLSRYAHVLSIQLAETTAGTARIELPKRLARWLLMCHDRLDGDDIGLTHDFIGMMLGVRRAGVTEGLHILEGINAIRTRRGFVTVVSRLCSKGLLVVATAARRLNTGGS